MHLRQITTCGFVKVSTPTPEERIISTMYQNRRHSTYRGAGRSVCRALIRTHDRSGQAAVDLRLRPRGHRDWQEDE
jgi:hypothetical protein